MNIYVYEDDKALDLGPLSNNRATFDIRIGSETFLDRIKMLFSEHTISLFVRDELEALTKEKHSGLKVNPKEIDEGLWLLGNVIWDKSDFKISTCPILEKKIEEIRLCNIEDKIIKVFWGDPGQNVGF